MAIHGNHSIYERTLATHERQSYRSGYPLFVQRSPILDGYWNKLAVILSVMLQELAKPAAHRLQWLLYVVQLIVTAFRPVSTALTRVVIPVGRTPTLSS
jgi:hypothetical protein